MATNNAWNSENPAQVARGGLGRSTLTDGALLLGDGQNPVEMLPMTNKGDLLVGDGTTSPQILSIGTDTYVLVADSAELAGMKWGDPDTISTLGAYKFISRSTISSDATIELTGLSKLSYRLVFTHVKPATDNVQLSMRVSNDGGSTFDSSSNYATGGLSRESSGTAVTYSGSTTRAYLIPPNQDVGNASGEKGVSGIVDLYGLNDASNPLSYTGSLQYDTTSGGAFHSLTGGQTDGVLDIDAIQIYFSSGNLASGYIDLYSLATS